MARSGTNPALATTVLSTLYLELDGGNSPSADIDWGGFGITNARDAVADQEYATFKQMNDLVNGLAWKDEVAAATVADITLSGEQTIDGIALVAGDRALAKNQTDQTENGIYIVAAGAWARSPDADTSAELNQATVGATEGTVNANRVYVQTTANPSIGVDNIVWVLGPNIGALPFTSILAGDDIETILEGAAAGEFFLVAPGVFTISGPILITANNLTIMMAEGTQLLGDDSGLAAVVELASGLIGLRWTGGEIRPDTNDGDAISALGTLTDCRFQAMTITTVGGAAAKDAFLMAGTPDNVIWVDCKFDGAGGDLDAGLRFNGGAPVDCKIRGNTFINFLEGAIAYEAGITLGLRQIITGNSFVSGIGIEFNDILRGVVISGNTFSINSTGILIAGAVTFSQIVANTFDDVSVGIDAGGFGQSVVEGNTFRLGGTFAIRHTSGAEVLYRGNVIEGQNSLNAGIQITGGTDIQVVDNDVKGMINAAGGFCIEQTGGTRCIIADNVCEGIASAAAIKSTVAGVEIKDNRINAGLNNILVDLSASAGAEGPIIEGNTCRSAAGDGISIIGNASHITGFTCSRNRVYLAVGDSIKISNADDGDVNGNRLMDGSDDGIDLVAVEETEINSNRVNGHNGGGKVGIREDATSDQNLYSSNHLRGNTGATAFSGTQRTELGTKP